MYIEAYGDTKSCSMCKESKPPSEFSISVGMECGLHNQCITCCIGNSQGNGGVRDFIFMPDKDGKKYKKKPCCERCNGTDSLAVDHILPLAKGGTDCIGNKQTLCRTCNSNKNDTIDCPVTTEMLCVRYRDLSLDFTDLVSLSRALALKVHEFKQAKFMNASLDDIKNTINEYIIQYNLGSKLDRIVGKIAIIFDK